MQKKPMGSRAPGTQATRTTVSSAEVARALSGAAARLRADEEKALRMIHGVAAPRTTVLERVGQDHPDSRERLLGLELELLRQWRERQAAHRPDPRSQAAAPARASASAPTAAPAAPAGSPKHARIVAALRSRKPRGS